MPLKRAVGRHSPSACGCTLALAGALSFGLGSCARTTTAPPPPARIYRTVTVELTDTLGTPVAGTQVAMVARRDSGGITPVRYADTDAAGLAVFVLGNGPWAATTDPVTVAPPPVRRRVAACTFDVAGVARPASDTVVVRLRLWTASRAGGTATLEGMDTHQGTHVSMPECLYPFAITDAVGTWVLDDLPPGTWYVTFDHPGFARAARALLVQAPGSDLAAGATVLRAHGYP